MERPVAVRPARLADRDVGERAEFLGAITEGAAERFLARYGHELGDDAETLRRAAALTGRWAAIDTGVQGLVHGDYRLDNLMFPEQGDGVVVLDWQTLAIGPPGRDLAYFLATSVLVDDRREHESALVAEYLDELRRIGVEDYSFEQCFADYRLGVLQGPMITMIGWAYATAAPSASADAMFLAMATRSCAAPRDRGSLELVARARRGGGRPQASSRSLSAVRAPT